MRFGGPNVPLSLRLGRVLVYIQAYLLGYMGIMVLVVALVLGGEGNGSGPQFNDRTITGNSAVAFVIVQIAIAALLVLLAIESSRGSTTSRGLLTVGEVLLGIYYVIYLASGPPAWIMGPGLSLAIIVCHNWERIGVWLGIRPFETPAAAAATAGSASAVLDVPAGRSEPAAEKPAAEKPVAEKPAETAPAAEAVAEPAEKPAAKPAARRRTTSGGSTAARSTTAKPAAPRKRKAAASKRAAPKPADGDAAPAPGA